MRQVKNTLFYYLVQKLNKILKRNKSKVIHLNYFAYKEVLLDIMNDIALRAVKQYRSNYGKNPQDVKFIFHLEELKPFSKIDFYIDEDELNNDNGKYGKTANAITVTFLNQIDEYNIHHLSDGRKRYGSLILK